MTIANENAHSLSQSSLAHELRDDPMEFGTSPAWPACQVMKHKMRRSGWNLQNTHQYHERCTFVAESHFPSAQCPEVLRLKQEASQTSIIQLPTSMAQNRYSDTKQSEGATVFGTWSALSKPIPRRFSNAQQSSGPTIGWSPLCTAWGQDTLSSTSILPTNLSSASISIQAIGLPSLASPQADAKTIQLISSLTSTTWWML